MSAFTLTVDHLRQIARRGKTNDNMRSIVMALDTYGPRYGLDRLHRLCHFLPQTGHESGLWKYDGEIWGPTPAQKRYDTRTDLGNTPEQDGDGFKNRGRGPFQLTGGYNIGEFTDWCRAEGMNPPDFRANPDLINTDPWEGLSAIWYWAVGNPTGKSLNVYADSNDIEMITRRINGGLNGYADRLNLYTRTGLVLLGYPVTVKEYEGSLRAFQAVAKDLGLYPFDPDGIDGPKTRAAIHKRLVALEGAKVGVGSEFKSAPVTEDKEVAVAPEKAERPGWDIFKIVGAGASWAVASFLKLDPLLQYGIAAFGAILLLLVLTGRIDLARTIRETRQAIEGRQ